MCYCPQNIVPPTAELAKVRLMLQLLAAGLFMVSLFAIIAGHFFFVVYALMMAYLLSICWATFNYQMVLYFFFIGCFQTIIIYIQVIVGVEYHDKIQSSQSANILFAVAQLVYFPTATIFSHLAYRHFKQYALSNPNSLNNQQMMPMGGFNQRSQNPRRNHQQAYQSPSMDDSIGGQRRFTAFQGQGIVIA